MNTALSEHAEELSLRDQILEPIFFEKADIKNEGECTPQEVFDDHRLARLIGSNNADLLNMMKKLISGSEMANPELLFAAKGFQLALSRWHKKLARIEKRAEYNEQHHYPQPFDTEDLARVVHNAAMAFFNELRKRGVSLDEDAEISGDRYERLAERIENIRLRFTSAVVIKNAPISFRNEGYSCLKNLHNVTVMNQADELIGSHPGSLADSAALYFGGSKRSDIASCTSTEQLDLNLKNLELDPEKFEKVHLRISGAPMVLVCPRGSQGIVGLKSLFKHAGVLLEKGELDETGDIFFLGVPDSVFEGVTGMVQGKLDGGINIVEGGYKRFHFTRNDGSSVFVVGGGKDNENKEIDYFGPFKKACFQLVATRQLRKSTEILTLLGVEAIQPGNEDTPYRYPLVNAITDPEAVIRLIQSLEMPFHGTTLFWLRKIKEQPELAEVLPFLQANSTINHTTFEGQSGMGKSEMEQFLQMILKNLRSMYQLMADSSDPKMRRLSNGLRAVMNFNLYSAGDDMGVMKINDKGQLYSQTHECRRFTRTDNVPDQGVLIARKTQPVDEEGVVTETTNTRVLEYDAGLEVFHGEEINVRNLVLASNLVLPGMDPSKSVQEVTFEEYMACYAGYVNKPNGTKDSDDPVASTAAMHEFLGQFGVAGTEKCENIVQLRRFMLEKEIERRDDIKTTSPMRFFVINTGIRPPWITDMEYHELKRPENRSEMQKVHFAHAAGHWIDAEDLLPEEIRSAFQFAQDKLGLELGQLASMTEMWSTSRKKKFLSDGLSLTDK